MDILIWLGIVLCLTQSAVFSGSNLAFFSLGRMRLEAEVEKGNQAASKVYNLRKDANLLLCTILWGNVSVNVLLAQLSGSVLMGVWSFLFSTVGITFFGEIIPQAYFSRHALRIGAKLSPLMQFYRILLYPVAKPCSFILDGWIGKEGLTLYGERDIEIILERHIMEHSSEISENEGRGALNFLDLDDRFVSTEGSLVHPETVYSFSSKLDLPSLPMPNTDEGRKFIASLKRYPNMMAVIVNEQGMPQLVVKTTQYLSRVFSQGDEVDIYGCCYRPVVVSDPEATLDTVLGEFVVEAYDKNDDVVDRDVVLYWTEGEKRIITGADIFGRLLRGIAKREDANDG